MHPVDDQLQQLHVQRRARVVRLASLVLSSAGRDITARTIA